MRKALLILGGLLVLALAAVLVLPSFWDWNRYRGEIAAQVAALTGRDFAVEGDVRLSLLPAPSLSATRLRLANPPGFSAPDMAEIAELRIRLAFWPLLHGEVRAESIELVRPTLRLERLADGRANWRFAPGGGPAPDAAEPDTAAGGGGLAVRLDAAVVRDGALDYRRPGGLTRIADLDGRLSAESLSGPFRAEGRMALNGEPVAFELRTGRIAAGAPQPAAATLEFPEAKGRLAFSGTATPGPDGLEQLDGRLEASAENVARLAQALGAVAGQAVALPGGPLAQAGALEARLTASPQAATLDDLTLALGQTRAAGRVALALGPPLDIAATLALPRLNLDEWLAAAAAEPRPAAPQGGAARPAASSAPALRARLDLAAEVVQYRGGMIRDAHAKARLDGGRLDLEALSAQLPGAASLRLAGAARLGAPQPRFDGNFEAKAGNLRGTLDWLGLDPPSVPADRLRSLAATGRLALDPEAARITDLKLQIDATRAAGALAVALAQRPSFSASLQADRVNLDAYLPPADGGARSGAAGAPARPATPPPEALRGFDANLDLRVEQLTYARTPIQRFVLDATLFDGRLEVRQAGFDEMAGLRARLAASLDGAGGTLRGRASVDATARDLPRTLRALEIDPPAALDGIGAVTLTGTAAGDLRRAEFDLTLAAGETRARLDGSVEGLDKDLRYAGALSANDRSFGRVIALFAPDAKLPQEPGPFALAARIEGDADGAAVTQIEATVGRSALAGAGSARWSGPVPVIRANLTGGDLLLDPFLALGGAAPGAGGAGEGGHGDRRWSSEPLDLAALRRLDAELGLTARSLTLGKYRIDDAALTATVKDGALDIAGLKGRLFGGGFAFDARLAAADPPTAGARLAIDGANLRQALFTAGNIELVEGRLDYRLEVETRGRSEREMVGALDGKAVLAVRDGAVRGFDLKAAGERLRRLKDLGDILALVGAALSGGETRFSSLDGSFAIEDGVATSNDLRLVAEAGEGRGVARIDLPAWRLEVDSEFRLADHPQAPPVGMRIYGPIDDPQRRFRTEKLQAYLLERGIGGALRGLLKDKNGAPAIPLPVPGLGPAPPQLQPSPAPPRPRPEEAAREILRLFQR